MTEKLFTGTLNHNKKKKKKKTFWIFSLQKVSIAYTCPFTYSYCLHSALSPSFVARGGSTLLTDEETMVVVVVGFNDWLRNLSLTLLRNLICKKVRSSMNEPRISPKSLK